MFSKILAVSVIAGVSGKDEVNVFYETNCPFSQGFIIDEVGAMMSDPNCVENDIKINWVPWGNAAESGGAIMCQHGPDECFGNRLHICAKEFFGADDIGMNNFVICHETAIRGNQFANLAPMNAQDEGSYAGCQMPAGKAPGDLTQCAMGQDTTGVWDKFRAAGAFTQQHHPQHAPWAVWPNDDANNMQGSLVQQLCAHEQQKGISPSCCSAMARRLQSPLLV